MADKKDTKTVSIRFPLKMYRRIKELAEDKHRSFNLQTVHLLTRSLREAETPTVPDAVESE